MGRSPFFCKTIESHSIGSDLLLIKEYKRHHFIDKNKIFTEYLLILSEALNF